jgi:Ankyrin repeats (3 copies)/Ankyrin repeat
MKKLLEGTEDLRCTWMRAALEGRTEMIKALLAKGMNVNETNAWGRTALMFATINLHHDTVQTLLESGANVNVRAYDGATALMLAACAGDIDTVRALLARGADVQGKFFSTGKNAAMLAADHGFDEIAQLIRGIDETDTLRSHTQPLDQVWAENELAVIRNQIPKKASNRLSDTGAAILGRREASTRRDRSTADALIYSE